MAMLNNQRVMVGVLPLSHSNSPSRTTAHSFPWVQEIVVERAQRCHNMTRTARGGSLKTFVFDGKTTISVGILLFKSFIDIQMESQPLSQPQKP